MAGSEFTGADGAADWAWLRPYLPTGFCLTFARGVPPTAMLEAFEVDPATVVRLTRAEAVAEFGFDDPVVRVGRTGDWGFGFEELGAHIGQEDVLLTLAERTEAVAVWSVGSGASGFRYARDGRGVVAFEPLFPHRRRGAEPDRLVPLMREVGLAPDRPYQVDGRPDPVLAALALVTRASGVRLCGDVIDGPLLTGELPPA